MDDNNPETTSVGPQDTAGRKSSTAPLLTLLVVIVLGVVVWALWPDQEEAVAPGATASATPTPTPGDSVSPTPSVSPPAESAQLEEPDGDQYQAFVVPQPEGESCTPFVDQRAQGWPNAESVQYDVTLPGVQAITQEWWVAGPVVMAEDEAFNPWYLELDAWLLADEVSAGNPSPGVGWEQPADGDSWRLSTSAGPGAAPGADDCAYVEPIPEISGATWLIIDGAEWAAVADQNPDVMEGSDDAMTWVYLGQAD